MWSLACLHHPASRASFHGKEKRFSSVWRCHWGSLLHLFLACRRSQLNILTGTKWNASIWNEWEAHAPLTFRVQSKCVWFFCCLQVAIRIPNCITLISGFNGYRDRHLTTQKQALRTLELLICYASVIMLWLMTWGSLASRLRGTGVQVSHQEPVGFQDFSQRLYPSCLKGSHPWTRLSMPSAQSVPSWALAAVA